MRQRWCSSGFCRPANLMLPRPCVEVAFHLHLAMLTVMRVAIPWSLRLGDTLNSEASVALHSNLRAGWRSLTVIAIKQAFCRVTLWVALPISEEKPAVGVGGAALPGVQDTQRAVPSVPVSSWATATSITGPISTSALTPLCSEALTPGPWGVGRAGASEAWAPQLGGL